MGWGMIWGLGKRVLILSNEAAEVLFRAENQRGIFEPLVAETSRPLSNDDDATANTGVTNSGTSDNFYHKLTVKNLVRQVMQATPLGSSFICPFAQVTINRRTRSMLDTLAGHTLQVRKWKIRQMKSFHNQSRTPALFCDSS